MRDATLYEIGAGTSEPALADRQELYDENRNCHDAKSKHTRSQDSMGVK